jgi:membrane protein
MKSYSPQSPEQRRKRLADLKAKFGSEVAEKFRPTSTPWTVTKRVAIGVYSDGFIHAGNLAYLAVLALFPFFILAAAVAHLFGQSQDAILTVNNILQRLPPNVAELMRDPIREVLTQRTGTLLWFGGGEDEEVSSRRSATSCAVPMGSNIVLPSGPTGSARSR